MRLGEFDPPEDNPYTKLDLSVIQSKQHQELALDAAMQSFVLLKNKNGFLPLDKKVYGKVAVSVTWFDVWSGITGRVALWTKVIIDGKPKIV